MNDQPKVARPKANPPKPKLSLYNVCSGKIRRFNYDNTKTDPIEGDPKPISPEEYLLLRFKALRAYPYRENPDLPDTVLVNTIHWYISQKLKAAGRDDLYEAYDGTALLAIAVEVEERIKASLGEHGHLMYAQEKEN